MIPWLVLDKLLTFGFVHPDGFDNCYILSRLEPFKICHLRTET